MECFCLGLRITVCGRSCKWPPLVAFRFHSVCYICAFQHETTLLCLSVPALGRMVNLDTIHAGAGGLVRARGVGHRGWDILSQPSEMPCRQPFIGLGENKPNCPSASPNDWLRQITADQGGPLSPFPTRLSLLLHRLSLPLPGWFYWRGNRTQKASVWEATCYLRVLGIEASAEASLSALMKAGRFGRFRSQHSSTPHPHLRAGTASISICLPFPASFSPLQLFHTLTSGSLLGEERRINPTNCFSLANLLEMLNCRYMLLQLL